ncbi:SMI1/KNR4 family protein [Chryseolinea sp. H1M3-3]|uniref:SMI1/KNR4 family protein n=1 Tax=Chryseolinea sp. H1M3-3 TaxID=3034144 RepID=UPI0023ED245F|nr:SMI1/KNR4 family protein [Chryseolinea sp. H1M3-3]
MNTTDAILRKYNWPTRTTSTDTEVLDIEREIRFELPADYKDFLSRYGGHETQIGEEYIKLWDKEDLLSLNRGYEIFENLPRTIGIGSNGAGEFIGIEKLDDGLLRIILTPFIDLDKQYHIEIGSSFTDFLLKLDEGEKWFKDIEKDS